MTFNLSDAIVRRNEVYIEDEVIHIQNVKQFIKELKDKINLMCSPQNIIVGNNRIVNRKLIKIIEKLAGESLTK